MKHKKSLIIILLCIALISIPISFAVDVQGDTQSDIQRDIQLNQENDLYINDNLEESLDDEILVDDNHLDDDENNLYENILNSNDETSQYEVSSSQNADDFSSDSDTYSNQYNNDLPDVDTSFAEIEIICTDENTIFVNRSYSGADENGSQLKPYKSLGTAFDKFNKNAAYKNIFLAEGTYSISSVISVSKSLNLIGQNTLNTVIDGLQTNQIFRISNSKTLVNMINLTLANGLNHEGGAIYISQSSLNLINVYLKNNHAIKRYENRQGQGGAIFNDKGFVKIFNSTFVKNYIDGKGSKYGGAIFNNFGELSIFNSTFVNNSITGDWGSGGAIYNLNGFLTVVNSSILNTTITPTYHSLGGAICIWNGRNNYIINSTISGNRINGDYVFGSAIANKGVLLEIIDSNITNNYANGNSVKNSTVYNMNGIYRYQNSIFSNNGIKNVSSNLLLCLEDQLILSNAFGIDSFGELPSNYDLRDEGLVTSVKNQNGGTYADNCWAFAMYAALESYLLKYENIAYDLSENHMKNAMYENGEYGVDWAKGGNHLMAFAYLLRGSGPVNEAQDPYNTSSIDPIAKTLSILKYVTGFKYIPLKLNYLDNNQLKYAILTYGALYTSVDSNHFKPNGTSYSNISSQNAHAVAIVGWDDNYSASNFAVRPPGDGAWIIKNSWGSSSGQEGYYYVSYYDSTFPGVTDQFAAIAISSVDNLSEYRSIYQYDPLGNSYESIGYNSNVAWFANQFTAVTANPLKAFGLYTFGSSSYMVNITVNGISKLVQTGNLTGAGYHTVKLNSLVGLLKGDVFKITVKLNTPDSLFPIAIESDRGSDYSSRVTSELKQSFISPNGINWYDIAQDTTVCKFYEDLNRIQLLQTNVCLKAYTEYADDLSIDIKSNSTIYTKGDLISLNITITNYGEPSGKVNLNYVLDNRVSILSAYVSKGLYNQSTKIWTIDNLVKGQKETLRLLLRFNENISTIKVSVYARSSAISSVNTVSKSFSIKCAKRPTKIISTNLSTKTVVASIDGKTGKYLKITLKDDLGHILAGKKIAFKVNNKTYYRTTNKKGVASLQINLAKAGTYKVKITFSGNNKLAKSTKTVKVYVKKQSLKLKVKNKKYKLKSKKKYLTAVLTNSKGKYIKGKKITFIVNGKKYSVKTNKKGLAKVKVSLNRRKTFKFTVKFAGDKSYKAVNKKAKVKIR